MNNRRRDAILAIQRNLVYLQSRANSWEAFAAADGPDLVNEAEAYVQLLIEEEGEYWENLPESAQDGERGHRAQEVIDLLGDAAKSMGLVLKTSPSNFSAVELGDRIYDAIVNLGLAAR